MKFYKFVRSFFSKVNNITESLEKGLDKVVSRGEKNFSVHRKYMNFLRPRKTALDEPLYKLSAGRSMVEMLGVLAIIGVLSVGAIAGYSKAMLKYRLNKAIHQHNQIISAATIHKNILLDASNYNGDYLLLLTKMGEVDKEIWDNGAGYDIFGNTIKLYKHSSGYLDYDLNLTDKSGKLVEQNMELCRLLYSQIFINRPYDFWRVAIALGDWTEESAGSYNHPTYGYNCTDDQKCIKDLTMTDINEMCQSCEKERSCRLEILW